MHCIVLHGTCLRAGFSIYSLPVRIHWDIIYVVWTRLENVMFASYLQILYTCILSMNELAHSKSCIEQGNKSYVQCVSDNGLHPVTWLSCPSGKAITFFLTYIGITN